MHWELKTDDEYINMSRDKKINQPTHIKSKLQSWLV